ncbi:spore germination protein, partial [Escherichia coli]
MSGPREGFTEPLVVNLSMLLRRLRTNDLKMRNFSIGKRTNTQVCVCYIEGIANENILKELYRRLEVINIDGIIDANYINEQIRDSKLSLFST